MSRSNYTEDWDGWASICWRGAVLSAIRGKRGQQFLAELLDALDSMKNKRLIEGELEANGEFCALGVIGAHRRIDMANIDPEDSWTISKKFNIAESLAREVVFMNDEGDWYVEETPEGRWGRMREWVAGLITKVDIPGATIDRYGSSRS